MNHTRTSITFLLTTILVLQPLLWAQTTSPPGISINPGSPVCLNGRASYPVSITLPPSAVNSKVDVFFLFDDTGSFEPFVPQVRNIFSNLVTSLETSLPGVEFGFGVGRLEDYGGPGADFSADVTTTRPFILGQPIVTAATAGGASTRNTLINGALERTTPGGGGNLPESSIEGLFQVATGAGFDGDGNGSNLNSGNAGTPATQTSPGDSGDVPPFSSNTATTSGTLGGVGWRDGALHLVILATDISSVAAFPAGAPIPATIVGTNGISEPITAFANTSTTPGDNRFGFVSNTKSLATNTVNGAVAPAGAATVQATVNALNALGIRVLGMGPDAAPSTSAGPSADESVWLSAMARLTGAVDGGGNPLVFDTNVPLGTLTTSIANAIRTSSTLPVNITLSATGLPAGLNFSFTPPVVNGVGPGGTANFDVTLAGNNPNISGNFNINFIDQRSGAVLGTVPVAINCIANPGGRGSSDQKPGSILVYPYYTSNSIDKTDTRLTLTNIGEESAYAHIFFIDGETCQQSDLFVCLTKFASIDFQASDYDPESTGWVLAVAVDANGKPIRNNKLIGNAFLNEGNYVDNYGAIAFTAHSPNPATLTATNATLNFDGFGYDQVPSQLAMEVQSPIDAPNQRMVTVGLRGDLSEGQITGAGQSGIGAIYDGDEKLVGSFAGFISGSCQAQAIFSSANPRIVGGVGRHFPSGQIGTIMLPVEAAVGLVMTPRPAVWNGIRTLHTMRLRNSTLVIPIFAPAC